MYSCNWCSAPFLQSETERGEVGSHSMRRMRDFRIFGYHICRYMVHIDVNHIYGGKLPCSVSQFKFFFSIPKMIWIVNRDYFSKLPMWCFQFGFTWPPSLTNKKASASKVSLEFIEALLNSKDFIIHRHRWWKPVWIQMRCFIHKKSSFASFEWLSLGQYGHLKRFWLLASLLNESFATTWPQGIIIGGFSSVDCSFDTGQTNMEWKWYDGGKGIST